MKRNTLALTYITIMLIMAARLFAKDDLQDFASISLDSLLNIPVNTASKYSQKMTKAPASISIVTAQDIESFGFQSLDEIIAAITGFYTSNDRNYSYLGARGFARPTDYNNRILLLLNGHTMNEDIYASAFAGTAFGVNLSSIEHIEIVRGPNSIVYGTGAMLAVINVITKTGKLVDGGQANIKYGSYGKKETSIVFGKKLRSGLEFSLSGIWGDIDGQDLYFESFDTPENNNGVAVNQDWDKYKGFTAQASLKDFTFQSYYVDRKKGIPTGAWGVMFNNDLSQSHDKRYFIELGYTKTIGINKTLNLRTLYDGYHYSQNYPEMDYAYFEDVKSEWYGGELAFNWDLYPNLRLSSNLEFQNHGNIDYYYGDGQETYFGGQFSYHFFSWYLQSEYQLNEKLLFSLGIRGDNASYSESTISPRLGVIYNLDPTTVIKGLYGEAFRAPSVYERNYNEEGYQKINPHLKPEKIYTREIIIDKTLDENLHSILSIYHYRMDNLIDFSYDTSDSLYYYANLGIVRSSGVEFEARWRFGNIMGFSSLTWQKAVDRKTEKKLSNSPQLVLKNGLTLDIYNIFTTGIIVKYESPRISVYENSNKSFILTDMHIRSKTLYHHLTCFFKIQNLFNANYSYPGGLAHVMDFIPQNKRNYLFGATLRF